jgi:catechol 2,3-dioxygenase-like lactoylglutathione lyase family enzyme
MRRTILRNVLALAVLAWLAPLQPSRGDTAATQPVARAVDSIGITVRDLDDALDFYTGVLPFVKVAEAELHGTTYEHVQGVFGLRMRVARLRLGSESIELIDYLAPEGRPIPEDSRSNDRWFQHIAIIVSDMDRAYAHLRKHDVQHASSGPQRLPDWNPNAGGIEAFYFKDPDGNVLEILEFPPGKGNPRWHQAAGDRLFLGIDHTAIVVGDTEASLAFYRDVLGLSVLGESENYGIEQEHLNNVFGARLRITALGTGNGPAVELLEYLAPTDGRPMPEDARPNDLIHWQTRIVVADSDAAASALRKARARFVSPGTVQVPGAELGFRRSTLVRDPDGHAMQLVEQ